MSTRFDVQKVAMTKKSASLAFILITILTFSVMMNCGGRDHKPVSFERNTAGEILDKIDVERGICVVLGDTLCELSLKLALQSELLLYVQLYQAENVEAARRAVDAAGFYGTRIYVEKGDLVRIHLEDKLENSELPHVRR